MVRIRNSLGNDACTWQRPAIGNTRSQKSPRSYPPSVELRLIFHAGVETGSEELRLSPPTPPSSGSYPFPDKNSEELREQRGFVNHQRVVWPHELLIREPSGGCVPTTRKARRGPARRGAARRGAARRSTTQYSAARRGAAQHDSTERRGAAQHGAARRSAARHSAARRVVKGGANSVGGS
eukprot:gene9629-biopygen185